jgi:uncharacterized membrane protein
MGHIRESIHIDAPIDQVWDLGAKSERYPEWQTGIVEVKNSTGPIDHVGAKYTAVYKSMGRTLEATFEVTRAEKPRLMEQRGTIPGGGHGTSLQTAEPAGGGTDVTITMDYDLPGGFVGGLADKLFMERALERDIRHSNENFKALCEAEAKIPA